MRHTIILLFVILLAGMGCAGKADRSSTGFGNGRDLSAEWSVCDEDNLPGEYLQACRTMKKLIHGIILNASGRYLCPYTQDDVLAEWTDLVINAKIGETAGNTIGTVSGALAGRKAADELLENVPGGRALGGFIGGMVGKEVGKNLGRTLALNAAGGMENVRKSSDISFNSIYELARYMFLRHSGHDYYEDALNAAILIYPELATKNERAVSSVSPDDVRRYRDAVKLLSNE